MLNYQPSGLSKHDLKNPDQVTDAYFMNFPIHLIRETVWDLYKGWIHHSCEYADIERARFMVSFYTETINYFNAAYVKAIAERGDLESGE